jgi:hypothetical protein
VGLGEHGLGERLVVPRRLQGGGAGFGWREAELLLFGGEVVEVVGELGEVAADVTGSDAGAEQVLAELLETEVQRKRHRGHAVLL